MTTSTAVAIRLPEPDWSGQIFNGIQEKCITHMNLLGTLSEVSLRKQCNKTEDEFLQAIISGALSKLNDALKEYVEKEDKRIEDLLNQLRDWISHEIPVSPMQKDEILSNLRFRAGTAEFPVYLYEQDMEQLPEWKLIKTMDTLMKAGFADSQLDNYMMRIADRLRDEIEYAISEYCKKSQLKLQGQLSGPEYLGKLRQYRKGLVKPSEGDWIDHRLTPARKEAYEEDKDHYCFTPRGGREATYYSLRERTCKGRIHVRIESFLLPAIDELSKGLIVKPDGLNYARPRLRHRIGNKMSDISEKFIDKFFRK